MDKTLVRKSVPLLASLLLADIADRRGQRDEDVLVSLIHRAAVEELGKDLSTQEGQPNDLSTQEGQPNDPA